MSVVSAKMDQEREPLVHRREGNEMDEGGFSWLTAIGFLFLTFNSGMAIYRSEGETASVAFVAFSYLVLVALFYCLRKFERTQPDSPSRKHLKAAVWILTTALTVVFSYKVAAIMPVSVKLLVWAMATATIVGGFYAFFLHQEKQIFKDYMVALATVGSLQLAHVSLINP